MLTCEAAWTWRHRAAAGRRGSKVRPPKSSWLPLLVPWAKAAGWWLHGHPWPEGLLGRPWRRCEAARWRNPSRAYLPARDHSQQ